MYLITVNKQHVLSLTFTTVAPRVVGLTVMMDQVNILNNNLTWKLLPLIDAISRNTP